MSRAAPPSLIPHSRPWINAADRLAVDRVLSSGMLAGGQVVRQFEAKVAQSCALRIAKFVPTGRAAMRKALLLVGVGPGDEVIVPTYVCPSVVAAVRACEATPVLCDVGADWCLDAAKALALRTERTRAIVVAHMFGISAALDPLLASGLPVIEDCAHALGGLGGDGHPVGSRGAAAIFSFSATKPLTAGGGGVVGTADARFAEALAADPGTQWSELSAPVNDIQAALGLSQMERLGEATDRRKALAGRYLSALQDCEAVLPVAVADRSMFYRFPMRVTRSPDELIAVFQNRGVAVRKGVDSLLHRRAGLDPMMFPGAEACFETTLSVPLYPALSDDEASVVIQAVCDELAATR